MVRYAFHRKTLSLAFCLLFQKTGVKTKNNVNALHETFTFFYIALGRCIRFITYILTSCKCKNNCSISIIVNWLVNDVRILL